MREGEGAEEEGEGTRELEGLGNAVREVVAHDEEEDLAQGVSLEGGREEAEEERGGQGDKHSDEDGGGEEDEGTQPGIVIDGLLLGLDVVVECRFEEENAQGL